MSATTRFKNRFLLISALFAGLAVLTTDAHGAGTGGYCDPLGGCKPKHFVKVTPNPATAGKSVTISGRTGHRCTATVYSDAFTGARHNFAGQPALHIPTNSKGSFSTKFKLSSKITAGKYHVGGRCGGAKFGSTTLKVKA